MYLHKRAPTGLQLRYNHSMIVTPACPICGALMDNGRQRVVATVMNTAGYLRKSMLKFKAFEVCAKHASHFVLGWLHDIDWEVGVLDDRAHSKKEVM